ncbi:hypothetical protein F383_31955 [Gossypium arboreum]|uniref:Uncharacterized protein n=1 Tax=Gossypium arboreum TaxID=29729 RepID=A0A0B0N5M2_GOSAR|nr:hypothetical protein F383_31955 [Gossypium arboreum]
MNMCIKDLARMGNPIGV